MSKKPGFTIKRKTATSAVVGGQEINLGDFRAYLPAHNYIFLPCREPWPALLRLSLAVEAPENSASR